MDKKDDANPLAGGDLTTVNSSGFPLQLALMHAVSLTQKNFDVGLMYAEHAWRNPGTDESGFIDLVVRKGSSCRFVVECKRVQEASWYFMSKDGSVNDSQYSILMLTGRVNETDLMAGFSSANEKVLSAWGEFRSFPACAEAMFCVVRGNAEASASRQALVERVAGELCASVEALASSEEPAFRNDGGPFYSPQFTAFYVPVIVTTASLKTVQLDPASISLKTGKLDQGIVKDVPFVKMTKQLSVYAHSARINPIYSNQYTKARERTVYIVNAEHFVDFMKAFGVDNWRGTGWPLS